MATPSTELQLPGEPFRMEQVLKLAPSGAQLGLVVALAAALTLAVGVVLWAARPSMVPLDVRLQGADRLPVINELENRRQGYEIADGMILVPQEERSRLRMELGLDGALTDGASLAVPVPEAPGSMSDSENDKWRRHIHSLERSLAQTISEIQSVTAASLHLAVSRRTSFYLRRSAAPSASVKLTLAPGRVLDPGQVAGIVNLVANAVPNLQADRVTVTDQRGRQLNSDDTVSGERSRDLAYKREYERMLLAKVESQLDALVGGGGYRASVDARFDFTRAESKRVIYERDGAVMRSGKTDMQGSQDSMAAMGVPGALENQPPEGGSLEQISDEQQAQPESSFRRSETINNEIPEETRREVGASWRLERISLAVVVDDRVKVDEAGETTRESRDEAELAKYAELLKTTVGFDEERGDRVSVVNMSLQGPALAEPPPVPALWEQPWFEQVVKSVLAGMALLLLVLMVIRPTARALLRRSSASEPDSDHGEAARADGDAESDAAGDDAMLEADRLSLASNLGEMLPPPARVHGDILNLAKEMAAQDPKRVATVLKKWMDNDE